MTKTRNVPALGAFFEGNSARFRIWAPEHERAAVVLYGRDGRTVERTQEMEAEPEGFFSTSILVRSTLESPEAPEAGHPLLYKLSVDGQGPFPDPFSRAQPLGVHGPSALERDDFPWTDRQWRGLPLEDLVLYEVHVGTATPEGTFESLIPYLDELKSVGITAIELMPLSSFPGRWNWGYDGVFLHAPAQVYGGPRGLRRLVDAAHARGLAVVVDAVYNHLGPDGNYLHAYTSRYFTSRHKTPWGDGINVDGADAAPVRELLCRSAEMWIRDYHLDGLRLDATHALKDDSDYPILREIAERAQRAGGGRAVVVIAEDERNEARLVRPVSEGGLGLDGVWADDFHHQIRRATAGDNEGYYQDFEGSAADIAKTLDLGWFYEGQPSKHAGRPRGTSPRAVEPKRFVHCIQNHDQIGNRAFGDRLGKSISPSAYRAISALLLLSPYTPLLFMGQEWNASTPFLYFTDHEPALGKLVTEGRRKEFSAFSSFGGQEIPDPQAEETFLRSKLSWRERERPEHASMLALYRELLALRATHPSLKERARGSFSVRASGETAIVLERSGGGKRLCLVVNLRESVAYTVEEAYRLLLSTEEARFGGEALRMSFDGSVVRIEGAAAVLLESTG